MLSIGKLAEAGGVGVETVRFYQRKGLLDTPPRGDGIRSFVGRSRRVSRWRKFGNCSNSTRVSIAHAHMTWLQPGLEHWIGRLRSCSEPEPV
jgi:hypothetical protein